METIVIAGFAVVVVVLMKIYYKLEAFNKNFEAVNREVLNQDAIQRSRARTAATKSHD